MSRVQSSIWDVLITITVIIVIALIAVGFFLETSGLMTSKCVRQFGNEYYYVSGGRYSPSFCTDGKDVRYLRKR